MSSVLTPGLTSEAMMRPSPRVLTALLASVVALSACDGPATAPRADAAAGGAAGGTDTGGGSRGGGELFPGRHEGVGGVGGGVA